MASKEMASEQRIPSRNPSEEDLPKKGHHALVASKDETMAASLTSASGSSPMPRADLNPFVSFPEKLMEIFEKEETSGTFMWNPKGDAFCLIPHRFSELILAKYFQSTKFKSFTRKLSRWGFTRIEDRNFPPGSIVFRHDQFKRGQPELLRGKEWKKKSDLKFDAELLEFLANTQRGKMIGIDATIETLSTSHVQSGTSSSKLEAKLPPTTILPASNKGDDGAVDLKKTEEITNNSPVRSAKSTAAAPPPAASTPPSWLRNSSLEPTTSQLGPTVSLLSNSGIRRNAQAPVASLSEVRLLLERNRRQQVTLKALQAELNTARRENLAELNGSGQITQSALSMELASRALRNPAPQLQLNQFTFDPAVLSPPLQQQSPSLYDRFNPVRNLLLQQQMAANDTSRSQGGEQEPGTEPFRRSV